MYMFKNIVSSLYVITSLLFFFVYPILESTQRLVVDSDSDSEEEYENGKYL